MLNSSNSLSDLYSNLIFRKQETKLNIVLPAITSLSGSSGFMLVTQKLKKTTLLISEYLHPLIGEMFPEDVSRNFCKAN